MIGYKLCKKKNGKYYPLYVNTTEEFVIGKEYKATEGPRTERGKVKSKLGELAYRPGIHLSDIPLADHIGAKNPDGTLHRKLDTAWLMCEISDAIDYTLQAQANKKKCLEVIPVDGFYFYNTNAQAKANWIIAGSIVPIREISRDEEIALCKAAGFEAQKLA